MTGECAYETQQPIYFRYFVPGIGSSHCFVALPTIARQTNGKTEIVRITQPVLKGEQVTKENAEVVEVGGYNLPANVAHSLDDVEACM